jgi:L-aminopeptidase/D-esterase-like protein
VIFDLAVGDPARRPDAAMGRAACEDAIRRGATDGDGDGAPLRGGPIGAACGASAGKLLGPAAAARTGFGSAAMKTANGYNITAVAVVNPLGDVLSADGRILAGARRPDGSFADSRRLLESGAAAAVAPGTNTTLVAVATDAPLSRLDLARIARMGAAGVARRIAPVNTPFDGDIVFALSTAASATVAALPDILAYGSAAATVVERAIERATIPENEG